MRINHVALSVRDLERSVTFYQDHFGFQERERFQKPGWHGQAVVLELNNTKLELFGFQDYHDVQLAGTDLKRIGINHFAIEVADVYEMYEKLKKAGVDISPPQKGTTITAFAFLRDPDGISVELFQS